MVNSLNRGIITKRLRQVHVNKLSVNVSGCSVSVGEYLATTPHLPPLLKRTEYHKNKIKFIEGKCSL